MNAFIGLLILCGTYSTHSASVSVPLASPCSGQEDGVLFNVHGKCSEFYICLSGKEVLQTCGAQLHFDAKNRQCIEASKSLCVDEEESIVISKPEIEEKPAVPANICSGKAIGAFVPSKTSCSDFYLCVGSKAVVKSCPEGHHFDVDAKACIRKELSKCVVKVEETVEEAKSGKPQLTGATGTTVFAETVCLGKPNGAKFAAPGSCSKYFACLQHKAYEQSCGVRHFDPLARACVDAASSDCVEEKEVVENLAVEEAETAQEVSVENNLVNATAGAVMGSPGKYIVIGGKVVVIKKTGLPVIKKSPTDSKITPIQQTGALPVTSQLESDVESIDIIKIKMDADGDLTASDSGVDIGIVDENSRAGNKGIFVGSGNIDINNEGSVSSVSVNNNKGEKERAGNTGVFVGSGNIDINNQGSISDASVTNTNSLDIPVENESSENDNSEIVIAVVDEDSAEQCFGVPSGSLLPKMGSCREFLTCEDGVAYVGQCPEGLHYNRALKICDWPELAGCA